MLIVQFRPAKYSRAHIGSNLEPSSAFGKNIHANPSIIFSVILLMKTQTDQSQNLLGTAKTRVLNEPVSTDV